MRKWFGCLCALWVAGAPRAWGAAATSAAQAKERLIVVFKPELSALEQQRHLEALGYRVVDSIASLRAHLVEPPAGVAAAQAKLAADARVLRAEPDLWRDDWLRVGASAEDAFAQAQEAFRNLPRFTPSTPKDAGGDEVKWGVRRVNAPAAWPTNQGAGVKVAIIDTGIDPSLSDLKARVAGGINAIDDKAPWVDDHFHGTHVAGIVAAELDGKGVVGVAPKATLYAVKVLTKEGSGDMFGIMKGIAWTGENAVQVANMSLGAPQEMPLIQYALQSAVAAGVTFVAAAGNDGKTVNWPAAYPECIAVSALCPAGVTNAKLCPSAEEGIATFSSRGPQVAFIAPGVLIPSTVPSSNDASNVHAYSGTSMATPHVTGLAALAVAKGAQGPDAVRAALSRAARKLPGLSAEEQGSGLIDAAALR